MWECTECVEKVEGQNYEFCWKCGAKKLTYQSAIHSPAATGCPAQALLDSSSAAPTLIDCPACRTQISNHALSCPHCGHPMKGSPESSGIASHREALEELIHPYKDAGYRVVQQTEYTITMAGPQKRLSVGTAVLLYIVFWPAGIAHTLSKWNARDDVACFRVLPGGQIEVRGDVIETGGNRSGSQMVWAMAGVVTILAIAVVAIIAVTR